MFYQNQNVSYKPVVSDVSNDDLINTVQQLEKSENVVRLMSFDIFKVKSGQMCVIRKPMKSKDTFKMSLIRSKEAMSELGKRMWASLR